jgi:hypothetical protein
MSPTNTMKHFFYNSILCYLVSSSWSAVRKFFSTNKRSRVAEHEEKKENISGKISRKAFNEPLGESGDYRELDKSKPYVILRDINSHGEEFVICRGIIESLVRSHQ